MSAIYGKCSCFISKMAVSIQHTINPNYKLALHYFATLNYGRKKHTRSSNNIKNIPAKLFQLSHQSCSDNKTTALHGKLHSFAYLAFNLIATDSVIEKCFKMYAHCTRTYYIVVDGHIYIRTEKVKEEKKTPSRVEWEGKNATRTIW